MIENSSKWLENTVGKGEIDLYELVSFTHGVFKRHVLQTRKNWPLFGNGQKGVIKIEFFFFTSRGASQLPFSNYLFLDSSKLKAYADNKIYVNE